MRRDRFRGLTGRALFRAVAPRLERAHRERLLELALERDSRIEALHELQRTEALVAHRELQFDRACARRNIRYQNERWRKLQDAYKRLEAVRAHAIAIGAVPASYGRRAA